MTVRSQGEKADDWKDEKIDGWWICGIGLPEDVAGKEMMKILIRTCLTAHGLHRW